MKFVWYVQDYNSMEVNFVFTTKKAAFAEAKEYGPGRFKTIIKGSVYHYHTQQDDKTEYACAVVKVPVIRAKRN